MKNTHPFAISPRKKYHISSSRNLFFLFISFITHLEVFLSFQAQNWWENSKLNQNFESQSLIYSAINEISFCEDYQRLSQLTVVEILTDWKVGLTVNQIVFRSLKLSRWREFMSFERARRVEPQSMARTHFRTKRELLESLAICNVRTLFFCWFEVCVHPFENLGSREDIPRQLTFLLTLTKAYIFVWIFCEFSKQKKRMKLLLPEEAVIHLSRRRERVLSRIIREYV